MGRENVLAVAVSIGYNQDHRLRRLPLACRKRMTTQTQTNGFVSHEAWRASGPERVARLPGGLAQTQEWKVRNSYRPSDQIRVHDQAA
jgi:hypothetical protein